ncbi:MAG: pentapeptide repeat-containing protein, partial [Limisphaerales bacterium]
AGGYPPAGSWSKETKCVTSNQNSVTDVLTHECYRCSDCADCLSFLDLSHATLHIIDFYGSDFSFSKLNNIEAAFACFIRANLHNADLTAAHIHRANVQGANLDGTNFRAANLSGINFEDANLGKADKANFRGARLDSRSEKLIRKLRRKAAKEDNEKQK